MAGELGVGVGWYTVYRLRIGVGGFKEGLVDRVGGGLEQSQGRNLGWT